MRSFRVCQPESALGRAIFCFIFRPIFCVSVVPHNDPCPGETTGIVLVLLEPLQEYCCYFGCRRAAIPCEVKAVALPVSQQRLDREEHSLPRYARPPSAPTPRHRGMARCMDPLARAVCHSRRLSIPLCITPNFHLYGLVGLSSCTQNDALAGTATVQFTVRQCSPC
jgi:hypothetical protein